MPEVDPQDPPPEPSFFWRRTISVAVLVASGVLVWWRAPHLTAGDTLTLLLAVLAFDFGVLSFYFAGASAADIGGMIANVKLRLGFGKKGSDDA